MKPNAYTDIVAIRNRRRSVVLHTLRRVCFFRKNAVGSSFEHITLKLNYFETVLKIISTILNIFSSHSYARHFVLIIIIYIYVFTGVPIVRTKAALYPLRAGRRA